MHGNCYLEIIILAVFATSTIHVLTNWRKIDISYKSFYTGKCPLFSDYTLLLEHVISYWNALYDISTLPNNKLC